MTKGKFNCIVKMFLKNVSDKDIKEACRHIKRYRKPYKNLNPRQSKEGM